MGYKSSPSDFSFLYEGCKRCFYLKVTSTIAQPSISLPAVFSKIASLLKDRYTGKHARELHPAFPAGRVVLGEKRVQPQSIHVSGRDVACYEQGRGLCPTRVGWIYAI